VDSSSGEEEEIRERSSSVPALKRLCEDMVRADLNRNGAGSKSTSTSNAIFSSQASSIRSSTSKPVNSWLSVPSPVMSGNASIASCRQEMKQSLPASAAARSTTIGSSASKDDDDQPLTQLLCDPAPRVAQTEQLHSKISDPPVAATSTLLLLLGDTSAGRSADTQQTDVEMALLKNAGEDLGTHAAICRTDRLTDAAADVAHSKLEEAQPRKSLSQGCDDSDSEPLVKRVATPLQKRTSTLPATSKRLASSTTPSQDAALPSRRLASSSTASQDTALMWRPPEDAWPLPLPTSLNAAACLSGDKAAQAAPTTKLLFHDRHDVQAVPLDSDDEDALNVLQLCDEPKFTYFAKVLDSCASSDSDDADVVWKDEGARGRHKKRASAAECESSNGLLFDGTLRVLWNRHSFQARLCHRLKCSGIPTVPAVRQRTC